MKNLFRNKNIPWTLICFGFVFLVTLAMVIDFAVFAILDDTAFTYYTFNNFLYTFTFLINGVFVVYHAVRLFWKKKSSSMLYILASASFMTFFYIIRLCLDWF